jgi:hypothetical protein
VDFRICGHHNAVSSSRSMNHFWRN